jgi:hypothetical protein
VQPLGRMHMLRDQGVERGQHGRGSTDMIGHCRDVQVNAFPGVAFALAVERLMRPVLLEQDHRQQAGPDPGAGDDMIGCRWLGDLGAVAAGELLAYGLPHEPAARDDVEGFGDDFPHLGEAAAAAARATRRRRYHDPLARQVRRQWPSCRALPGMFSDHGFGCSLAGEFGRGLVLGRGLLELGQLELELGDEPGAALAGGAEPLAAGFGQEQLEALDLEPGAGHQGQGGPRLGLGLEPRLSLGADQGMRGGEILRQWLGAGRHIFTKHSCEAI